MNITSNLNRFKADLQSGNLYEPLGVVHLCKQRYHQTFPHWHSHYEILLIVRGSYTIENGGQNITGTCPRAIVHFPYSLHRASTDHEYDRYMVTFTRQAVQAFSPKLLELEPIQQASFICTSPTPNEMDELLTLADLLKQNQQDAIMCALLTSAMMQKIILISQAGRGEIVRGMHPYIQEALGYIAMHMSKPLTAEELAAHLHVSKTKFNIDFRATVGKSYKQHLTDLRQTFARELLDSGASIINTAMDTGYSSEAHFIKAFREYWGITPGEYRRQSEGCD